MRGKSIVILYAGRNGIRMQVQFWDTAGQEHYQAMINAYFRGANGIILMFDLTNMASFEFCKNW